MPCSLEGGGIPHYDKRLNFTFATWDNWHKKITAPNSSWLNFKRGDYPQTVSKKFKEAVRDLADLLLEETTSDGFHTYLATIMFLKEHPKMNVILLGYATFSVDLNENFTVHDIITPIEVTR